MARSAARNSLSASGFSDNRLRTLAAPALPITLRCGHNFFKVRVPRRCDRGGYESAPGI